MHPEPAPSSESPRRRRRGPLALAVVVVLLLAAAGAAVLALGDDDGGPTTEAQRVEEAYRNYWAANLKAGEIPDPSSPELAAYATGTQLQAAVADLEKLRQQGQAIRQVPNSKARRDVTVISVDGDRARLSDCTVDDSIVVSVATGRPAFDYPPGAATTTLFTAAMVREQGSWKVASLAREQRWEGVAGCAVGQS